MVRRRFTTRAFWLMLAVAGLFSMFTVQSTYTLKFNHIPGRLNARAGGTAASLAQRERVEKVAADLAQAEESPVMDLSVAVLAPEPGTMPVQQRAVSVLPASPGLWPPPLLFRPPPALSVA
ncbi:hypothetical protein [Terriglobus sp. RCC_193]|uniref:hypothetical protein n=1 Tax=Terriglobus sp. RCC_193 TaxID=3239218 RepID=UPI00352477CE